MTGSKARRVVYKRARTFGWHSSFERPSPRSPSSPSRRTRSKASDSRRRSISNDLAPLLRERQRLLVLLVRTLFAPSTVYPAFDMLVTVMVYLPATSVALKAATPLELVVAAWVAVVPLGRFQVTATVAPGTRVPVPSFTVTLLVASTLLPELKVVRVIRVL